MWPLLERWELNQTSTQKPDVVQAKQSNWKAVADKMGNDTDSMIFVQTTEAEWDQRFIDNEDEDKDSGIQSENEDSSEELSQIDNHIDINTM